MVYLSPVAYLRGPLCEGPPLAGPPWFLPAGCHGNLTVFTQCVSDQKSAFSPLQEKLCVGSKNDSHLLELSRRSLSACKVWGRSNYARRLWKRKLVFFACHAQVCLRMGDIVQTSIVWRLISRFWCRFQRFFSAGRALLGALHGSHLCRQVASQFSRNCRQISQKVQKIGGKVCAHHFV